MSNYRDFFDRQHQVRPPFLDNPASPLLQDAHMQVGHFSIGGSSVYSSAGSDRASHSLAPRGSASSYLTRRLEDQQKPLLALMMERSEGEARYQATTTKEIFESVRRHAASLGSQRRNDISTVPASTVGSVNASASPSPTPDWEDGDGDEAPGAIVVAAARLRSESVKSERKRSVNSGVVTSDDLTIKGASSHITRLVRYRDIDRLSPLQLSLDSPAILVRRHAVLLLLDPLRAVIMADRFILIVPEGADNILAIMNAYIAGWPCRKNDMDYTSQESVGYVPFEYLAFEAVLETVIAVQNQEFLACAEKTRTILHSIKDASLISLQKQEKLAFYKNQIATKLSRCRQHRKALDELMNDDDALALMNLSRLRHDPSLYSIPLSQAILTFHEDAEALFDSYQIEFSSLETKIQLLKEEFHNAEDLASLRLATSQNKLLFAESIIILSTVFLTTGGFFGGLYGMNLKNHTEEDSLAFRYVCIFTLFFILVGTYAVFKFFRGNGTYPRIFDAAYFNVGTWKNN